MEGSRAAVISRIEPRAAKKEHSISAPLVSQHRLLPTRPARPRLLQADVERLPLAPGWWTSGQAEPLAVEELAAVVAEPLEAASGAKPPGHDAPRAAAHDARGFHLM